MYRTKTDFIEQAIIPTLGEFAGDFDAEAIFDEVATWDAEAQAFDWKPEYDGTEDYWAAVRDCEKAA